MTSTPVMLSPKGSTSNSEAMPSTSVASVLCDSLPTATKKNSSIRSAARKGLHKHLTKKDRKSG